MFAENLKKLRKSKGLSQEELAERLHVTRQTISKWERGLSVPDADLLIHLSEIFDTPVGQLLGFPIPDSEEAFNSIPEKLEQLNLLLAERNRRSRRIWRIVAGLLIGWAVLLLLFLLIATASFHSFDNQTQAESIPVGALAAAPFSLE